jgi:predicted regulator of Ras-like GTPase activity (Roadblock/LC7/MglB family)
MDFNAQRDAALHQLASVPGVVGSAIFDRAGAVEASVFPDLFDPAGLDRLASQLASDGYFQEWVAGEKSSLAFRYQDGNVTLRGLREGWLLVLWTSQANEQLLSMSLTQVVRRLAGVPASSTRAREHDRPAGPSPVDRLCLVARSELGPHAAQAVEILTTAGPRPRDLLRAVEEVEKMVRLFISKKQAEDIARRMREALGA